VNNVNKFHKHGKLHQLNKGDLTLRKVTVLLTIFAVLLVAIMPAYAQDGDSAPTIADIVVASATSDNPEFTTLLAAVQAADPAVLEALSDPEAELTVFAPTDEAFGLVIEALGEEAFNEILADQEFLTEILLYHVIEGAVFSEDVVGLLEENEGAFTVQTLQGQYLDISLDMDMGDIYIDDAKLILDMVDIEAANGVIHVIDAVLLPETNTIADLVIEAASDEEAPEFTTLLAAVQAADPAVLEALSDPEAELTVFAPTDEAFAALGEDTINAVLADQELLTTILLYHVLDGVVSAQDAFELLESEDMEMMSIEVETLSGDMITVSTDEEGNLFINDATVVINNIDAANGIIHVIDTVLIPSAEAAE